MNVRGLLMNWIAIPIIITRVMMRGVLNSKRKFSSNCSDNIINKYLREKSIVIRENNQ